jgi:hypothetical protein
MWASPLPGAAAYAEQVVGAVGMELGLASDESLSREMTKLRLLRAVFAPMPIRRVVSVALS